MRRRLLAIPIRWQLMVLVIVTMAPSSCGFELVVSGFHLQLNSECH